MGKLLIIFILIVFANCSEEQNVLVTKKKFMLMFQKCYI